MWRRGPWALVFLCFLVSAQEAHARIRFKECDLPDPAVPRCHRCAERIDDDLIQPDQHLAAVAQKFLAWRAVSHFARRLREERVPRSRWPCVRIHAATPFPLPGGHGLSLLEGQAVGAGHCGSEIPEVSFAIEAASEARGIHLALVDSTVVGGVHEIFCVTREHGDVVIRALATIAW